MPTSPLPRLPTTMSSDPLPANEAELLTALGGLPYLKRHKYAVRLARQHAANPALISLIRELLQTSPLSSTVPFHNQTSSSDSDDMIVDEPKTHVTIELQFPQSNASKRFVQRELGLTIAAVIGKDALPIFAEALIHPSDAGRRKAIGPFVTHASDDEVVEVYNRCVPAVQAQIAEKLDRREEVRKRLGLPGLVRESAEPAIVTLERELKECEEEQRAGIWAKSIVLSVWPHRHLSDPKLVPRDSMHNLAEHLFNLAERYPIPVTRKDIPTTYTLPQPLIDRLGSLYVCDLERAVQLVRRYCHAVDPEQKGRDVLSIPSTFNAGKKGQPFWSRVSLEKQMAIAEPFLTNLVETNDGALLKNGQLHQSGVLSYFRWPVIRSVVSKALPFLVSDKITEQERKKVWQFVCTGAEEFESRLWTVASVDKEIKRQHQTEMEDPLLQLILRFAELLLDCFRRTEKNDEEMVKKLRLFLYGSRYFELFITYPTIARALYERIAGVFSMTQVSKDVLSAVARDFFNALKRKVPLVFDIPDNGYVQPYSNIPQTNNDDVFEVLLNLKPPPEMLQESTYTSNLDLSPAQKERVWNIINDPELIMEHLFSERGEASVQAIINIGILSPSPAARQPIISALLLEETTYGIRPWLYTECDISDPENRSALQKLTYTRVFGERLQYYRALIDATNKSQSVQEWIKTLKWFIPRTKNEIVADAENLIGLFPSVEKMVYMFRQANDDEAKELVELYLGWEKQNNENVSVNSALRKHLMEISQTCLHLFSGDVFNPFFQFGLDLPWVRILNDKGLASARKAYYLAFPPYNPECDRDHEEDETARRKFMKSVDLKLGRPGYWRIQDEEKFVEKVYEQYEKIFGDQSFPESSSHLSFVQNMIKILGLRWEKVPRLVQVLHQQMDVVRRMMGSGDKPANWDGPNVDPQLKDALAFVRLLKDQYRFRTGGKKRGTEQPSWWKEFRDLRLLSSEAMLEVEDRRKECYRKGKVDRNVLGPLVEQLVGIHHTAVYIPFVRNHLMQVRQDLIEDSHILEAREGSFNDDVAEDEEPIPPTWDLTASRRLFLHQCEVFAKRLREVIHSEDTPLKQRVAAAEQFTKLPTTTIHELATLLTEELNPRIWEAILMFLPHLDEPPAGIQFLLAPVFLDGDFARTAIFGVKRSLQYVKAAAAAEILADTFPQEKSKRQLKVTVAKEVARALCEYAELPGVQDVVGHLWNRKLHPDVRVTLLQSILPLLDSPREQFAWSLILDAVSNPKLQLDDTLYALLAVAPSKPEPHNDDIVNDALDLPTVLEAMSTVTIPDRCCDKYLEEVLWPLARLKQYEDIESMSKHDVEQLKERISYIRSGAYRDIFDRFLTTQNATKFAQRAVEDITHAKVPGESTADPDHISDVCPFCAASKWIVNPLDCPRVFIFLANSIGHCCARDPLAWSSLVGVVDSLAAFVAQMKDHPTSSGILAHSWLESLNLDVNFRFENPPHIRKRVTHDRLMLLQPLKKRGILDRFPHIPLGRRINLFRDGAKRANADNVEAEGGTLIEEIVTLAQSFVLDLSQTTERVRAVLEVCPPNAMSSLRTKILDGALGVAESSWSLQIKMKALGNCFEHSEQHARSLSSFLAHVATNEPSFYRAQWNSFATLIHRHLSHKDYKAGIISSIYSILINPVLERDAPRTCDRLVLDYLYERVSSQFCSNSMDWVLQRIHDLLLAAKNDDPSSVRQAVLFSKELMTYVSVPEKKHLSLAHCMIAESVYFGTVSNLNLKEWTRDDALEPIISYPYFSSIDDSDDSDDNGGDIEDRSGKSTVPALEAMYEARKADLGKRLLKSQTTKTNASSATLAVLIQLYDFYPKLAIAHPSLFFSCFCLSCSSPDMLDSSQKLADLLKSVLQASRESESGSNWGWVPPPSLALSFARKMLTDAPEEISDISLDENWIIGPIRAKLLAVDLLTWWRQYYEDTVGRDPFMPSVLSVERGDRLMQEYEDLKLLAWKDEKLAVRNAAMKPAQRGRTYPLRGRGIRGRRGRGRGF
ncbi:hypothetical protein D9758_010905 [Tetrapyrgos nigripes]|uniref:Uncharacterized protein n=1 Tax=Tetrapyrgos nigripes TaxID=182062 RepID=A0A8H5CVJ6_9AGAR|nr:hypothetical protein D9758_010905 [Tetrapyrgos nigripes]